MKKGNRSTLDHPILSYLEGLIDFSQSFNHVIWHITNRCNLICTYCYTSSSPWEEKESEEVLIHTARAIGMISPLKLSVIGGEPLLVKNLPQLLKIIKDLSPKTEIHIDTNLTLLTPQLYQQLHTLVAYWNTTIDHYLPEKHNTTRGLFHQTVENIKFLVDNGERVNVVVVVTSINYKDLENIVYFLLSLGVDKVVLARSKPLGRGANDPNVLRDEELGKAMEKVANLVDNRKVFATGWFHRDIPDYYGLESCYCGVYQFTVNWRGEAVPCESMIHERGIDIATLAKEGLNGKEIVKKLSEAFRRWGALVLLYPAVCVECELKNTCRKSCRYQALKHSNNPLGRPILCNMKTASLYDVIGYTYYSPIYPEGRARWKTYTAYMVETFLKKYGSFVEYGAGGGVWIAFAEQLHNRIVRGYEILPSMIQLWELYKMKHSLKSEIIKRNVLHVEEHAPVIMVDNFITHFNEEELVSLFSGAKGPLLLEFVSTTPKNREGKSRLGKVEFEEKIEVIGRNKVRKTVCRGSICHTTYQYLYTADEVLKLLDKSGKKTKHYEERGRWVYVVAE